MPRSRTHDGGQRRSDVASAVGFRRVEEVLIVVTDEATTASATGVLHRYPQTVPISMSSAARLAAAGVPVRVARTTAPGMAAC